VYSDLEDQKVNEPSLSIVTIWTLVAGC